MNAEEFLEQQRPVVEKELERRLAASLERVPEKLAEAMRYGVLGGGKRLRPALVLATSGAVGQTSFPSAMQFGCALELVHAYSLIHDDLRRGRPTVHKAFGEAFAILAGDALLTLAFEWTAGVAGALGGALCRELAAGAGAVGMVGGQALDIAATGRRDLPASAIEEIHRGKTSGLFAAATAGGALCAGAPAETVDRLRRYGDVLGLAFQAADDYLDVVADPDARGKRQGGDEAEDKATLVRALGLDGAKARAEAHAKAAGDLLGPVAGAELLHDLALYAARRTR